MRELVPTRREPAAREGEVVPAWPGPLRDIDSVFDQMWRNFFPRQLTGGMWPGSFAPAVDVEETGDAYIFEIELPGVRREDVTVETNEGELHISGRVVERERTGVMRHRMRRTGEFSYRISLPADADPDHITASHENGVLTITIPRWEGTKPRRIDIV